MAWTSANCMSMCAAMKSRMDFGARDVARGLHAMALASSDTQERDSPRTDDVEYAQDTARRTGR